MKTSATTLFGGALFAAGLMTVGSAHGDFSFSGGYARVSVYDFITYDFQSYSYLESYDTFSPAPGAISVTASHPYVSGTASATMNATTISMDSEANPGSSGSDGHSWAFGNSTVTVDNNTQVEVNWDFTDATLSSSFTFLHVYNITDSQSVYSTLSGSGTEFITLEAGKMYYVNVSVLTNTGNDPSGSGFASLTIVPTPGALALLGLAGCVSGARRRRKM